MRELTKEEAQKKWYRMGQQLDADIKRLTLERKEISKKIKELRDWKKMRGQMDRVREE